VDWAASPLGAAVAWTPALRNALDLALGTRFPVTLFWGPQFVLVYNEAYAGLIGDKHPAALGRPAREVFPEAWEAIGPMMQAVLAGHGATWVEDEKVPLWRGGRLEERWFTFSYSPVRGGDGVTEGVLDIATETTRQVLALRRLELLGRLRDELGEVERAADVTARALPLLHAASDDLPWVDIRPAAVPAGAPQPGVVRIGIPGAERVLIVRLSEHLVPDAAYLGFLRLIAVSLGEAIGRAAVRQAERRVSEVLQRSLLVEPAVQPGLEIAVRYRPAAEEAQIGGDWFDAFALSDGSLAVVVGDVTGHDADAAAAMAQVRNLLRGVAYTLEGAPADVLAGVDRAMEGLGIDVFASAVLALVAPADGRGRRDVRWSNAGHLPPVLVLPGGDARLQTSAPDVLLGLGEAARTDHALTLPPGAALVVYTDGLIERRGVSLVDSLEWLAGTLRGHDGSTAEQLCDHVIGQLDGAVEDDVAMLVLRVAPAG
jgi:hypothetical protein